MLFLQLLVDGLVSGCAIGLVAVSFSLYYSTTRVFHVAHAGIYTLGGYLAWYGAMQGIPFAIACALAVAGAAFAGAVIQRFLYDELERREATPLVMLIASLGALAVLQNGVAMLFTPNILQFPNPWRTRMLDLGIASVSYAQVLVAASGLAAFGALMWMSRRTLLGRRIRAVASNPFLAEITRLGPRSVYLAVMAIASAMAALSGIMVGLDQVMQPYTGVLVLLTATIAVIAGGIGSLTGAFVVAVALSVLQNVALILMPGRWSIAATFALFVVFILVKPEGLFRKR